MKVHGLRTCSTCRKAVGWGANPSPIRRPLIGYADGIVPVGFSDKARQFLD